MKQHNGEDRLDKENTAKQNQGERGSSRTK